MSFDPQDPKWTAYVLGELDDDARSEIDTELAGSPEAQRYVDELRRTIDLVSSELQAEPCPVMADAEPAELEPAEVAPFDEWSAVRTELAHSIRPEGHSRSIGRKAILALAASLLAVVSLSSYLLSPELWHVRDIKLAWKSDRKPNQMIRQSTPDGELTLDDESAAEAGPALDGAIDHLVLQESDLPEVTLQLQASPSPQASPEPDPMAPAGGIASGRPSGMGGGTGGKPGPGKPQGRQVGKDVQAAGQPLSSPALPAQKVQLKISNGDKGQGQPTATPSPVTETKTRKLGQHNIHDAYGNPVAHPDELKWKELPELRRRSMEPTESGGVPAKAPLQEVESERLRQAEGYYYRTPMAKEAAATEMVESRSTPAGTSADRNLGDLTSDRTLDAGITAIANLPRSGSLRKSHRQPVPAGRRGSALDVLDRRRYGVVLPTSAGSCNQKAQLPPDGRRADRGAGQLLPLRLSAARRATTRSRSTSRWPAAPGTPSIGWSGSASRDARSAARMPAAEQPGLPDRRLGLDAIGRTSCRW